MNKRVVVLVAVALLAVGLFGATKAYAQEPTPVSPPSAGKGPGSGLLHDYMTEAMFDVFGINTEELDEIHESESTLFEALGLPIEEFRTQMAEVRQIALENAAADGVISQDQADWMSERMLGAGRGKFGPGNGSCLDGDRPAGTLQQGGRGRGRW